MERLTFGVTCKALCNTPSTPISVELLLNKPPNVVTARKTFKVSTELLATTTTLSPFRTPCAFIALASCPTSRLICPQLTSRTSVYPSLISVTAILPSSFPIVLLSDVGAPGLREYNKFSAKFKETPSNHLGIESILADSSTTFV